MRAESKPVQCDVRLLVGVCGSLSAVAVPHLLLWMRSTMGVSDVRVVMTESADRMISRRSLNAFLPEDAVVGWDDQVGRGAPHVALAHWAEAILVLPATANFLGKTANGIADDVLTATVMAAECPVIVLPATNAAMWSKPALQRNVRLLREDGVIVLDPQDGIAVTGGAHEVGSLGDYRQAVVTAIASAYRARKQRGHPPDEGRPAPDPDVDQTCEEALE